MFNLLLRGCLELITVPCCRVCHRPQEADLDLSLPCPTCLQHLGLTKAGIQGQDPLPWWSLGPYQGPWRHLLLRQRKTPDPATLLTLGRALRQLLPDRHQSAALVPIPSWKRKNSNPLPKLISQAVGLPQIEVLQRSRPTLGQHHLNRQLRALNQVDAFRTIRPGGRRRPILLVDDILTTGATAIAASEALRQGGYQVAGLLCLARTPEPGGDLRSRSAAQAAGRDSSVGRAGD